MRLQSLESRVFIGLVLGTTVVFAWVIRGFLLPIFWAAVFAILFRPVFLSIEGKVRGRRSVAALLSTLVVVLVVIIPSGLLVLALAQQALDLYERLQSGQIGIQGPIDFVQRSVPALTEFLAGHGIDFARVRSAMEAAAVAVTQRIGTQALSIGQDAITAAILFALMLYLLFFFFRDGDQIMAGVVRALPMGDEREMRMFERFADVSRATVKGTLVVAAVQGALGGVMFGVLGLQAAVFWGVAMGVLSLLPAVGPALVWIPAAIYFFASGSIGKAIVTVIGGALVIGLVDNLLRPILVGRGAKMPDYLVLVATLGGLTVFGIAGFVAGPIIAALFLVMWEMFAEEYAPLDSSAPPAAAGGALAASPPPTESGDGHRVPPAARPDRVEDPADGTGAR